VAMLLSLAGRSHEVLTGLALAGAHGVVSGVARTSVRFRDFDEATARRYAETGEPMDKAGAYGIQGLGAALVEGLDGDYYSVVGLPVRLFLDLLERAGWRYDFGEIEKLPG
jgi:septum formation protein